MFMVEANEVLGRLFEDLGVPLLRRIHPEPTPGDTNDLRKVATVAGFKIPRKILFEREALPRTPTGKVQKFLLVERYSPGKKD